MKIEKGNKFLCIKDVVMSDGDIAYKKGEVYRSERDGCITDIQGVMVHIWTSDDAPHIYFKPLSEVDRSQEEDYDDPYNWVVNGMKDVPVKKTDSIVKSVIDKYQQRSEVGIKKYGTTLEENEDGIEIFLTHLQEEMMDATLYIEKLKHKFAKLKKHL